MDNINAVFTFGVHCQRSGQRLTQYESRAVVVEALRMKNGRNNCALGCVLVGVVVSIHNINNSGTKFDSKVSF